MATPEAQVGGVGVIVTAVVIENGVTVNVSAATVQQILIHRTDNTTLTKTSTFQTNGVDAVIQYTTTTTDDFSANGLYRIQGYVEISSTVKIYTPVTYFVVLPNV